MFNFGIKQVNIFVHSFNCDAPAKAYLKCVKNHNGYSSCDKCEVVGKRALGRIVYSNLTGKKVWTSHLNYKLIKITT